MNNHIDAIHHVGHLVTDIASAIDRYRRLGFHVPAPAYPVMPPSPGAAPEAFGAGNTHAYFPRSFVELVTVVENGEQVPADASLIPLHAPDDRLPAIVSAIRGTAANLAAGLRRFEGVHILMFLSRDVEHTARQLAADDIGHGGVTQVGRPVETSNGPRTELVRYLEIDGNDPSLPGRVPEGRIGVVENPPADILDAQIRPEHPNGAVDLVECLLCVSDADLVETRQRYQTYLGRTAKEQHGRTVFDLGEHRITLVPESAVGELFAGHKAPGVPGFLGYTLAVRDIAKTRALLRANEIPLEVTSAGDSFVPAAAAFGAAIIFRQQAPDPTLEVPATQMEPACRNL